MSTLIVVGLILGFTYVLYYAYKEITSITV
jgi:hypothetical protein